MEISASTLAAQPAGWALREMNPRMREAMTWLDIGPSCQRRPPRSSRAATVEVCQKPDPWIGSRDGSLDPQADPGPDGLLRSVAGGAGHGGGLRAEARRHA